MDFQESKDLLRGLNLAYFYLRFRSRTKKEVFDYLVKKSKKFSYLNPALIEKILEDLEEQKLIDDNAFVGWFVQQRLIHKPKGEYALRQELRKFGVEKTIIDSYFLENPLNQEIEVEKALESKWRSYQRLDTRKRFEKAANFLLRRGFSFDIVKKTIAEREEKE